LEASLLFRCKPLDARVSQVRVVPGDGVQVLVLLELDCRKGCAASVAELFGEFRVLGLVGEVWDVALRLLGDVEVKVLEPPAELRGLDCCWAG
jgi:hypothetical protein